MGATTQLQAKVKDAKKRITSCRELLIELMGRLISIGKRVVYNP